MQHFWFQDHRKFRDDKQKREWMAEKKRKEDELEKLQSEIAQVITLIIFSHCYNMKFFFVLFSRRRMDLNLKQQMTIEKILTNFPFKVCTSWITIFAMKNFINVFAHIIKSQIWIIFLKITSAFQYQVLSLW